MTPQERALLGPVEKLFLDISDRLATVDDIEWIDLEAGQLEIPEETYPVQFPCVLIDFPSAEFENETQGNQQATLMVQVKLGIDLYEDLHMSDGNATPDRDTAVNRLGLITKIHKVLHGFEGDYFTPLVRMGFQTERRDDGIKVFTLLYGTGAKDDSACKVATVATGLGMTFRPL